MIYHDISTLSTASNCCWTARSWSSCFIQLQDLVKCCNSQRQREPPHGLQGSWLYGFDVFKRLRKSNLPEGSAVYNSNVTMVFVGDISN